MKQCVKEKYEGIVAERFHTTPITIRTLPPNSSADDLKGRLLEEINDDPEETELRRALIKSMKKAEKKDEPCKTTKSSKRRHDDPDPDDHPKS